MYSGVHQFADPAVTRSKYELEVAEFQSMNDEYRGRGWFLLEAKFPKVLVAMCARQTQPATVAFGVDFDFTNYDAAPPSVRLVNPFTREPFLASQLPTTLNRALPANQVPVPGMPGELRIQGTQPLMQAHSPDDVPFLCIAGVREYHDHPGHSGDSWELHRSSGAGRLVRLLEVIAKYGVDPIRGFAVNLVPQVALEYGEPPA